MANIAADQRIPTMFEVATLRSLKRPRGISGASTRDSSQTKKARPAAATPRRPSVCADVQPCSLPFTIA
jgi:hypothetical protein